MADLLQTYRNFFSQLLSVGAFKKEQLLHDYPDLLDIRMLKLIEVYIDGIGKRGDVEQIHSMYAILKPFAKEFLLKQLSTYTDDPSVKNKLNWGRASQMTGRLFQKLTHYNIQGATTRAIDCYINALVVFTAATHKSEYILMHEHIAHCCCKAKNNESMYWIDKSLFHFQQAIDQIDPEKEGEHYGRIKKAQAVRFLQRATAVGSQDVENAIACYEDSLGQIQEGSHEWAIIQTNIGLAYLDIDPKTKKSVTKAIAHLEKALPFIERTVIGEWAILRYNLAYAYLDPLTEPTSEIARRALLYLEETGLFFLEMKRYQEWANVQMAKCPTDIHSSKEIILRAISILSEVEEKAGKQLKPFQLIKIYNKLGFNFMRLANLTDQGYKVKAYHYFGKTLSEIKPTTDIGQWTYALYMSITKCKELVTREQLVIFREAAAELIKITDSNVHTRALSLLYSLLADINIRLSPGKESLRKNGPYYEKAIALLASGKYGNAKTELEHRVGNEFHYLEMYDEAFPFFKGALESCSKEKMPYLYAELNMKLAQAMRLMKNKSGRFSPVANLNYLLEAEAFFKGNSFPLTSLQIYFNLGSYFFSYRRYEQSYEYGCKALEAIVRKRDREEDEKTRQLMSINASIVYNLLILTSFKRGDLFKCLECIVQAKSRLFIDKLHFPVRTFEDIAVAYPDSVGLLEEIRETGQSIQLCQKTLRESNLQVTIDDQDDRKMTQRHLVEILENHRIKFNLQYSNLLHKYPISVNRTVIDPLTIEQIANLRLDFPVIEYYFTRRYWMAIVLLKDGMVTRRLADGADTILRRAVRRVEQFETKAGRREQIGLRSICQLIYKVFVEPLREVIDSYESLIIAPNGLLHKFPIGLAQYPDGTTFSSIHNISVLPSTAAAAFLIEKRAIIEATPTMLNVVVAGKEGKGSLPHAIEEQKSIGGIFKSKYHLLEKEEATVQSFGEVVEAEQPDIIHFTCHSQFDARIPFLSGLQLYEGDLTIQHIVHNIRFKKNPLIVLGSCESGRSAVYRGDEFTGLTSAFFYAGAGAVISSLWPVDDRATQLLLKLFYTKHSEGMSYSRSLKAAMTEVRGTPGFEHPFYWAAFQLHGVPT